MSDWPLVLICAAVMLGVIGGLVSLAVRERAASRVLLIACGCGSVIALIGACGVLALGDGPQHVVWQLPVLGPMAIGTTRLGALFLCFAAIVYVPTTIYTLSYVKRYAEEYSLRAFCAWYCALFAAIVGLFVCRDVVSFFLAWESVAITSSALVTYEWRRRRNANAAFLMLAMSEAGTMGAILAMLIALKGAPTLLFGAHGGALSPADSWAVFLLSLFGFGVKAGLLPVNSWLPLAHPLAPGSVSAILSGVILNLGVYGIVVVDTQLVPVTIPAQGIVLIIVGVLSALIGILYATIDDDLKSMLAYSSIENMGIAVTGIGVGLVFIAEHQPLFAAIGFAAGMYHLVNHSAYKGLLFLGAATVDVQVGTRSMNRLGGLLRRLPVTGGLFLVGALSIAAVPPFNGFVSEWLTFQALLRSVELQDVAMRIVFALAGAGLALTAALAVTCFVKAFGMMFLGWPRAALQDAGEPAKPMRWGMALLAIACALLGVLPTYVLPAIGRGIAGIVGDQRVADALVPPFFQPADVKPLPPDFLTSFHALGAQLGSWIPGRGLVVMLRGGAENPVVFAMSTTYLLCAMAVFFGVVWLVVRFVTRGRSRRRVPAWGGGLRPLRPEMTYSATGFSNPVRVIFHAVFHPIAVEDERETIHEHFRSAIRRKREEVFLADRLVGGPITVGVSSVAALFARIHHGRLPVYVGYAIGALIVALSIVALVH